LEQLGCWLTPACQAWQAAKFLPHFVVYPLVDGLSVEQKHGLDVPPVDTGGQSFILIYLCLLLGSLLRSLWAHSELKLGSTSVSPAVSPASEPV